jgi:hypothetical protein
MMAYVTKSRMWVNRSSGPGYLRMNLHLRVISSCAPHDPGLLYLTGCGPSKSLFFTSVRSFARSCILPRMLSKTASIIDYLLKLQLDPLLFTIRTTSPWNVTTQ